MKSLKRVANTIHPFRIRDFLIHHTIVNKYLDINYIVCHCAMDSNEVDSPEVLGLPVPNVDLKEVTQLLDTINETQSGAAAGDDSSNENKPKPYFDELAIESIVNIMKFLIPIHLDSNPYGIAIRSQANGNEYDDVKKLKKQCDFRFVCKSFRVVFHTVTRANEYKKLCQLMFVDMLHFEYQVNNKEDRYLTKKSDGTYTKNINNIQSDHWWSIIVHHFHDGNKGESSIEAFAKILTLSSNYAFDTVHICCDYFRLWMPLLIKKLGKMRKENPNLSVNCKRIVIDDCAISVYKEEETDHSWDQNWGGGIVEHEYSPEDMTKDFNVCHEALQKFATIIKKLSHKKCNFGNGLYCMECKNIDFNKRSPFSICGDIHDKAKCFYCKTPILPNFKCCHCIRTCECIAESYDEEGDYGEDTEEWAENGCASFVCLNCIDERNDQWYNEWWAPNCPNHDHDDDDDDNDDDDDDDDE